MSLEHHRHPSAGVGVKSLLATSKNGLKVFCYDRKGIVMDFDDFKPGIYLHYKGNLYEVDHLMRDANDATRIGVHYIGLELDGARDGPRHLIRTWKDWNAKVHDDGTICQNYSDEKCLDGHGNVRYRFRYLGPFYESTMATTDYEKR